MKSLKFTPTQIDGIKNGNRTTTWRLYDDKELYVNDDIQLVNSENGKVFGYATVNEIRVKRLKDLNLDDQHGNEQYGNQDEIIEAFKRYYGPKVDADSIVKVIRFSINNNVKDDNVVTNTHNLKEVKLYTDGGSRGNPGPSAAGFVVIDYEDNVVKSDGEYLGITTNNQAEYQAVRMGLECVLGMGSQIVHVYLDSLLVANQMNGIYKIRNRDLWPIHDSINKLIAKFKDVKFTHVPRELNKLADAMVNEILDANGLEV